jgi:hypothetical protein
MHQSREISFFFYIDKNRERKQGRLERRRGGQGDQGTEGEGEFSLQRPGYGVR